MLRCFHITVARKTKKGSEIMEFINRPKSEADGILRTFGRGSAAHRKEGWAVTGVEEMACLSRTANRAALGRARKRRRR